MNKEKTKEQAELEHKEFNDAYARAQSFVKESYKLKDTVLHSALVEIYLGMKRQKID